MRSGRSTGTPTKAQQARFDAIKGVGCIACRMQSIPVWAVEIHHLTIGGKHGQKRRGHDFTVGLCAWHHRGEGALPEHRMAALYGPSYAREPRLFRETFGQDDVLLAYQNDFLQGKQAA